MVPASSVSASVKRLEQELGTELFIRYRNRIELSESGKQLLSAVSNTLTQLDTAVNAISQQPAEKQTISILARCTRQTVTSWIVRFYRRYPSVNFKLSVDDIPSNYENYDVIVSSPDEGLADYESFPWRRYFVRVEALTTDPLCRGPITLNQLRDRLFVTTNTQRGIFQIFAQACKKKGFTPKVYMECDDYVCRNMLVRSGICLGLVAISPNDSVFQNVHYLTLEDFSGNAVVNIYYKEEKYAGNVKLFLEQLKKSEEIFN